MNKAALFAVSVLLVSLVPSPAQAAGGVGSAFGTFTTAQSIGQGRANFGVGVGLADATSVVGSFTYGLSKWTDGRIKLGLFDRNSGNTKLVIGADFKWQFWNYGPESTHPFDFAVGGLFEFVDLDNFSALQIGGQLIASYPVKLKGGGLITPYGKFNTRLESLSDRTIGNNKISSSDSNIEIGISGGVLWKLSPNVGLFGEFQIDGNDGIFFGADFNVQ